MTLRYNFFHYVQKTTQGDSYYWNRVILSEYELASICIEVSRELYEAYRSKHISQRTV